MAPLFIGQGVKACSLFGEFDDKMRAKGLVAGVSCHINASRNLTCINRKVPVFRLFQLQCNSQERFSAPASSLVLAICNYIH